LVFDTVATPLHSLAKAFAKKKVVSEGGTQVGSRKLLQQSGRVAFDHTSRTLSDKLSIGEAGPLKLARRSMSAEAAPAPPDDDDDDEWDDESELDARDERDETFVSPQSPVLAGREGNSPMRRVRTFHTARLHAWWC
jgi:hypothetical protein